MELIRLEDFYRNYDQDNWMRDIIETFQENNREYHLSELYPKIAERRTKRGKDYADSTVRHFLNTNSGGQGRDCFISV